MFLVSMFNLAIDFYLAGTPFQILTAMLLFMLARSHFTSIRYIFVMLIIEVVSTEGFLSGTTFY
jgi:hypothetical protein